MRGKRFRGFRPLAYTRGVRGGYRVSASASSLGVSRAWRRSWNPPTHGVRAPESVDFGSLH